MNRNWSEGKCSRRKIHCRSENSKGVYCLQYDNEKIVSGLRDNTIKIWDKKKYECSKTLSGHTGSVLCLQYDQNIIVSGSSDTTVRVWDMKTGNNVQTLHNHKEPCYISASWTELWSRVLKTNRSSYGTCIRPLIFR